MLIRTSEALAIALAKAVDGAVLTLATGAFALPPGWTATRPITLVGQGSDATRLVGHLAADGDVTLTDLAIAGHGRAPVIHARSGHLTVTRCRLADGILGLLVTGDATAAIDDTEIVGHRGDGVRLSHQARATVSRCLIERNGGDGVAAWGEAELFIENSLVLDNRGCGVAFREATGGEAYGNLIQGHRGADLVVSGIAGPRLAENTVPEPEPEAVVALEAA
ncbi:hypothetical protein D3C72_804250 [compost metagenome]